MSWALGGGISAGDGLASAFGPTYLGAIERRLTKRSWLLLNVLAGHRSSEVLGATTSDNPNPPLVTKTDTFASGLLGLRYVFLQGIVDVSGTVAALATYRKTSPPTPGLGLISTGDYIGDVSQSLGLQAGIAAERPLVEGLALRLSLQMACATFDWGKSEIATKTGETLERKPTAQSLSLLASPSLALYFYF